MTTHQYCQSGNLTPENHPGYESDFFELDISLEVTTPDLPQAPPARAYSPVPVLLPQASPTPPKMCAFGLKSSVVEPEPELKLKGPGTFGGAGAGAGMLKFRLRLPAPGQTKLVY
jgi:hypothetical protein